MNMMCDVDAILNTLQNEVIKLKRDSVAAEVSRIQAEQKVTDLEFQVSQLKHFIRSHIRQYIVAGPGGLSFPEYELRSPRIKSVQNLERTMWEHFGIRL